MALNPRSNLVNRGKLNVNPKMVVIATANVTQIYPKRLYNHIASWSLINLDFFQTQTALSDETINLTFFEFTSIGFSLPVFF